MRFDEQVHADRRLVWFLGGAALAIGLCLGFVIGVLFMLAKAL